MSVKTKNNLLSSESPSMDRCWGVFQTRFYNRFVQAHRNQRDLFRVTAQTKPLLDWGKQYLPDHFALPPSLMHRWLGKRLDLMSAQTGQRLNLLGPRGGAKSTLGTLAFPLRMALEGRARYIWILSDTLCQAQTHLANLKNELESNARLLRSYPESAGQGPRWSRSAIKMRNGTVIEAFGTGQKLRGRRQGAFRPDLIIADDLQNDTHILNANARETSLAWFESAVMKAGNSRTNFVCLATALHPDAIALRLTRNPGWTSRTFASILRWPKNMALWTEWEDLYLNVEKPNHQKLADLFYRRHESEMNEGASVVWQENEDLLTLMKMRAEEGHTAFEREKQNSPMNPELCEWPESYFDDSIWFEDWPRTEQIKTLALDPSKGADAQRGDYSAFVQLLVDRNGILYVQANMQRRPIEQIISDGVELCRTFRPHLFAIETNQFQQLLADGFSREFRSQGIPCEPLGIQNSINKTTRIRTLGALLSSKRIRFRQTPDTKLLVEQLKQFPLGDHDDGPDALEMAVRIAADALASAPNDGLGTKLSLQTR